MFEKTKIKRILSIFPQSEGADRKIMLEKLASFGERPMTMVLEELRYNRMLYSDASDIFCAIYKNEYLPVFIKGLGDSKENIRALCKNTIVTIGKSRAIPALVENITSGDNMIRKIVGDILIELGDNSIVGQVIPLLRHEGKDVKKTAMDILSSLKAESAVNAILPLLDDQDSWLRRKAMEALCRLENKQVMPRLLEQATKDRDSAATNIVLETMGKIGGPENASALLVFLKSQDLVIRQKATDALARVADSSIVPAIMELLRNTDVNVRRAAVSVLDGIKDPRTASALVKGLKDGDWWVRELATDALSELGGGHVSQMIMELLNDDDEDIRRCAVEFFCRVKDPNAFDPLLALLADEDWWVREKAITALGLVGDPRAITHITKLVNDGEVKWAIPGALGAIGTDAVLKPLASFLKDPQKQVRLAALTALAGLDVEGLVDAIKPAALDDDPQMREVALKALRDKTGRVWGSDEIAADIKKERGKKAIAEAGDLLTEAIVVVDLCKSTDTASAYGDHAVFNMVGDLGKIIDSITDDIGKNYKKSTGDGFLVTMDNVASAASLAVQTMKRIVERNAKVEENKKLNIRFAINMGETRVDPTGDRLGNAVNMAFRVESVREADMITAPDGVKPGDIPSQNRVLITEVVYNALKNDSSYNIRFLGFFELKGLTGLHRVYELLLSNDLLSTELMKSLGPD